MIPRYAIIPTRGRPDDLTRCVESISGQVNHILIIDNNDTPNYYIHNFGKDGKPIPGATLEWFHNPMQPPNLSRLWNAGLDLVADRGRVDHDVAIFNDDAIVPPGWYEAMSTMMRGKGGAAACQQPFGEMRTVVHRGDAVPSVATRLTGWAFLLRGELGLRFDEQFEWWCGDDDMSVQARNAGGLVHVPGFPVQNVHANESTVGELLAQSAVDMKRFVDKHGRRPW